MKLNTIQIKDYRSIENITFEIVKLGDKSQTYGLIGVNEAGKSSILKALALKDGIDDKKGPLPRTKDFREGRAIEIIYDYTPNEAEIDELKTNIATQFPELDLSNDSLSKLILKISFIFSNPNQKVVALDIPGLVIEQREAIQEHLKQLVLAKSHKSIFWTAEEKYLITEPINLSQFAEDTSISVPLQNCFSLLEIKSKEDIKSKIMLSLSESTEREQLRDALGNKVTEHINLAWPGHKIKITFDISDGLINFHVHDLNAKGRAKTADQRSDGFGQFVSFLLSVSAQNKNEELINTIVLIDEPETHLHPQAQEDMLEELIKISQNALNNIVFFATHSNYLIDKEDLSRNYRISKLNGETEKEQLRSGTSTYASITYEVFGISSGDYHNELYDLLRDKYAKSENKDLDEVGITEFDNGFFRQQKKLIPEYPFRGKKKEATLPTYIRNAIHYPENRDKDFEKKLKESIDILRNMEEKF